ncbi:MAG: hypothetical protein EOP54_25425 [Sphingobacteriales bacterium]|nr:MAG: hypothetical protein EOP54_25425 [Sphingobacteriales bacterium]
MEKYMNMQDKELDALFHAKLDDLEVEPSANLWAGIAAELDADKKKTIMPYLSIAATILVLVTAGILFIPKAEDATQQPVEIKITKQQPAKALQPVAQTIKQPIIVPATGSTSAVQKIATVSVSKPAYKEITKKEQEQIIAKKIEAPVNEQQPVLAAITRNNGNLKPVVPDTDIELSAKTISAESEPFKTKPVVMASANLPQTDMQEVQPVKKKKINSFGGLLNALVSKIDKRKDKLIEFDDANGENNITGINLGILKLKKEEQ